MESFVPDSDYPHFNDVYPAELTPSTDEFVKFKQVDLKQNIGQITIPFLKVDTVEPDFNVPLSGISLYHSRLSAGDFLGVKLFTYDFAQNFKWN